jgi:hypothetical protein
MAIDEIHYIKEPELNTLLIQLWTSPNYLVQLGTVADFIDKFLKSGSKSSCAGFAC